MTEKELLNSLEERIEKAEEMLHYYKEQQERYNGIIEALKDLQYDLNQKEEEKKGE